MGIIRPFFYPVLTSDHIKMISSSRQIEALSRICKFSVFDPFFAPRPHNGTILHSTIHKQRDYFETNHITAEMYTKETTHTTSTPVQRFILHTPYQHVNIPNTPNLEPVRYTLYTIHYHYTFYTLLTGLVQWIPPRGVAVRYTLSLYIIIVHYYLCLIHILHTPHRFGTVNTA